MVSVQEAVPVPLSAGVGEQRLSGVGGVEQATA